MKTFLRMGTDCLSAVEEHPSISEACAAFLSTAKDLNRYGQKIDGALHFAPDLASIAEYPDRVLSLGPRGGLKMEKT